MELVLFCGLQAAGKSRFYWQRFGTTHLRINMDMLRTRRRESTILGACLAVGQRVVIDNTNPTSAERAPYLDRARQFHFSSIAYFFEPDFETCLVRNAARSGKERVPEIALRATALKLEPPTLEEGFARIFLVSPDGRFRLAAEVEDETG